MRNVVRARIIFDTVCPLKIVDNTDILIINVIDSMWPVVVSEMDSCNERLNYMLFVSTSQLLFIDNINHLEYTIDSSIMHDRDTVINKYIYKYYYYKLLYSKLTNDFMYELYEIVTPYIEYTNRNIKLSYASTPDNKFLIRGYEIGILIQNHIKQFSKVSEVEDIIMNGFTSSNLFKTFINCIYIIIIIIIYSI